MRKIEQQMLAAMANGEHFKSGNTRVYRYDRHGPVEVTLHGNKIAEYWPATGRLTIYDGGWESVTTKSRLNAILYRFAPAWRLVQRDWVWYLDDLGRTSEHLISWEGAATFENGEIAS